MDKDKRKRLEAAGYVITDAAGFLGLTDEESQLVELRLATARAMQTRRKALKLTQKELAVRLKTSQARVARMESASADVSLDQIFRGFYAVGGNLNDLRQTGKRTPSARRPATQRAVPTGEGNSVRPAKSKKPMGDPTAPLGNP